MELPEPRGRCRDSSLASRVPEFPHDEFGEVQFKTVESQHLGNARSAHTLAAKARRWAWNSWNSPPTIVIVMATADATPRVTALYVRFGSCSFAAHRSGGCRRQARVSGQYSSFCHTMLHPCSTSNGFSFELLSVEDRCYPSLLTTSPGSMSS